MICNSTQQQRDKNNVTWFIMSEGTRAASSSISLTSPHLCIVVPWSLTKSACCSQQKVRWDLQGQRAGEGTTLGSDEGGGIKLGSASLIGGCIICSRALYIGRDRKGSPRPER